MVFDLSPIPRRAIAAVLSAAILAQAGLADAALSTVWSDRRRAPAAAFSAPSNPVPLRKAAEAALPPGFAFAKAIPASAGAFRFDGPPAAPRAVLVIQDVHGNTEAQGNISAAVSALLESGVRVVGLEGAEGALGLNDVAHAPVRRSLDVAADFLLRKSLISGAARAALSSNRPDAVVGIDDAGLHERNADAYRRAAPSAGTVRRDLAAEADRLSEAKRRFNPALREFDAAVTGHRTGRTPFVDYAVRMTRAARDSGIAVPTGLAAFVDLAFAERNLDMAAVERERNLIVERLASRLDGRSAERLLDLAAAFRAGTVGHAAFYAEFRLLCRSQGIDFRESPALSSYLDYIQRADRLDPDAILRDAARVERDVFERLAADDEERSIVHRDRQLHLDARLASFAMTRPEWEEWKGSFRISPDPRLTPFSEFYEVAELRDAALAANLVAAMNRSASDQAAVVVGGFHTEGLARRLSGMGVSVAVFTPAVSEVSDGSAYLSVFSREKSNLERVVEDRALFLAQNPAPASARFAAVHLAAAHDVLSGGDLGRNTGYIRRATGFAVDSAAVGPGRLTFDETGIDGNPVRVVVDGVRDGVLTALPTVQLPLENGLKGRAARFLKNIWSGASAAAGDLLRRLAGILEPAPLTSDVTPAERSRRRLDDVRRFLAEHPDENILGLVVFGSVAEGTAEEDSDLDYMMVKRSGQSFMFLDFDDMDFHAALSEALPYIEHPPLSPLILESEMDKRPFDSFDMVVRMFFIPPEMQGIQSYGMRAPGGPMITNWRFVAADPQAELEGHEIVSARIMSIYRDIADSAARAARKPTIAPERARPDDVEQIANIRSGQHGLVNFPPEYASVAENDALLLGDITAILGGLLQGVVLVIRKEGRVIGYAMAKLDNPLRATVAEVIVARDERDAGHGTALITEAVRALITDFPRLEDIRMSDGNPERRTTRIARRLGFTEFANRQLQLVLTADVKARLLGRSAPTVPTGEPVLPLIQETFSGQDTVSFADLETGSGRFVARFKRALKGMFRNVDAVGVDTFQSFVTEPIEPILHAAPEEPGDYERVGLADASRNIVTINTIEPTIKVPAIVDHAARIVRPGGLVIVTFGRYDIPLGERVDRQVRERLESRGFTVEERRLASDYPTSDVFEQYEEMMLVARRPDDGGSSGIVRLAAGFSRGAKGLLRRLFVAWRAAVVEFPRTLAPVRFVFSDHRNIEFWGWQKRAAGLGLVYAAMVALPLTLGVALASSTAADPGLVVALAVLTIPVANVAAHGLVNTFWLVAAPVHFLLAWMSRALRSSALRAAAELGSRAIQPAPLTVDGRTYAEQLRDYLAALTVPSARVNPDSREFHQVAAATETLIRDRHTHRVVREAWLDALQHARAPFEEFLITFLRRWANAEPNEFLPPLVEFNTTLAKHQERESTGALIDFLSSSLARAMGMLFQAKKEEIWARHSEPIRILEVNPEVRPFRMKGGMGVIGGTLAPDINRFHAWATTVSLYYDDGNYDQEGLGSPYSRKEKMPFQLTITIAGEVHTADVYRVRRRNDDGTFAEFYFLKDLFPGKDNATRTLYAATSWEPLGLKQAVFLSEGSLQLMKELLIHEGRKFDVVRAHDWQAALAPIYLKTRTYAEDPDMQAAIAGVRPMGFFHNLEPGYRGEFDPKLWNLLGLDDIHKQAFGWEWVESGPEFSHILRGFNAKELNLAKALAHHADGMFVPAPTYARLIQSEEYGFDMASMFRARAHALAGVLNGAEYNPADELIYPMGRRSVENFLEHRRRAKIALLKESGMWPHIESTVRKRLGDNPDPAAFHEEMEREIDRPIIGAVVRLDPKMKGVWHYRFVAERLTYEWEGRHIRFVVLGDPLGSPESTKFVEEMKKLADARPDRVAFFPQGRVKLSKIYRDIQLGRPIHSLNDLIQSVDINFYPSRVEPCGLADVEAANRGTFLIVSDKGGFADKMRDIDDPGERPVTGIVYHGDYNDYEHMLRDVERGLAVYYNDRGRFHEIQASNKNLRFTMQTMAREHVMAIARMIGRHDVASTPEKPVHVALGAVALWRHIGLTNPFWIGVAEGGLTAVAALLIAGYALPAIAALGPVGLAAGPVVAVAVLTVVFWVAHYLGGVLEADGSVSVRDAARAMDASLTASWGLLSLPIAMMAAGTDPWTAWPLIILAVGIGSTAHGIANAVNHDLAVNPGFWNPDTYDAADRMIDWMRRHGLVPVPVAGSPAARRLAERDLAPVYLPEILNILLRPLAFARQHGGPEAEARVRIFGFALIATAAWSTGLAVFGLLAGHTSPAAASAVGLMALVLAAVVGHRIFNVLNASAPGTAGTPPPDWAIDDQGNLKSPADLDLLSHHQVLGLDRSAGSADVKSAYRAMARRYHSDVWRTSWSTRHVDGKSRADIVFQRIFAAYEALRNAAPDVPSTVVVDPGHVNADFGLLPRSYVNADNAPTDGFLRLFSNRSPWAGASEYRRAREAAVEAARRRYGGWLDTTARHLRRSQMTDALQEILELLADEVRAATVAALRDGEQPRGAGDRLSAYEAGAVLRRKMEAADMDFERDITAARRAAAGVERALQSTAARPSGRESDDRPLSARRDPPSLAPAVETYVGGNGLRRVRLASVPPELREIIERFRVTSFRGRVFLTGGFVRDLLLGRPVNDVDFLLAVNGVPADRQLDLLFNVSMTLFPGAMYSDDLTIAGREVDTIMAEVDRDGRLADAPLTFSFNRILLGFDQQEDPFLLDPEDGFEDLFNGGDRPIGELIGNAEDASAESLARLVRLASDSSLDLRLTPRSIQALERIGSALSYMVENAGSFALTSGEAEEARTALAGYRIWRSRYFGDPLNPPFLNFHPIIRGLLNKRDLPALETAALRDDDQLAAQAVWSIHVVLRSAIDPTEAERAIEVLSKVLHRFRDRVTIEIVDVMAALIDGSIPVDARGEAAGFIGDLIDARPDLINEHVVSSLRDVFSRTDLRGKDYAGAGAALMKLIRKNPRVATPELVDDLERLFRTDGLDPHGYYGAAGVADRIRAHRRSLITEHPALETMLAFPEHMRRHSFRHHDIYRYTVFADGQDDAHRYTVGLAAFRLLEEHGFPVDRRNVIWAVRSIERERIASRDRVMIGPGRRIIRAVHGDSEFDPFLPAKIARRSGVRNPEISPAYKGARDKERILEDIGSTSGPVSILFNVHSDPENLWFDAGHAGETDEVDPDLTISFRELGDALLRNPARRSDGKPGIDLSRAAVMIAGCHSYNFARNLLRYLKENGVTVPPDVVASSNQDRYSIGDSLYRDLDRAEIGRPVTIGDIFEAEAREFRSPTFADYAVFARPTDTLTADLERTPDGSVIELGLAGATRRVAERLGFRRPAAIAAAGAVIESVIILSGVAALASLAGVPDAAPLLQLAAFPLLHAAGGPQAVIVRPDGSVLLGRVPMSFRRFAALLALGAVFHLFIPWGASLLSASLNTVTMAAAAHAAFNAAAVLVAARRAEPVRTRALSREVARALSERAGAASWRPAWVAAVQGHLASREPKVGVERMMDRPLPSLAPLDRAGFRQEAFLASLRMELEALNSVHAARADDARAAAEAVAFEGLERREARLALSDMRNSRLHIVVFDGMRPEDGERTIERLRSAPEARAVVVYDPASAETADAVRRASSLPNVRLVADPGAFAPSARGGRRLVLTRVESTLSRERELASSLHVWAGKSLEIDTEGLGGNSPFRSALFTVLDALVTITAGFNRMSLLDASYKLVASQA